MRAGGLLLGVFLGVAGALSPAWAESPVWQTKKSKHFIVHYNYEEDRAAAETILRRAEEYYDKVAALIGYARYSDFWTWEERVKIIIFPDQETFVRNTGQPAWSRGFAYRDAGVFRSRMIVTYRQERDFIDGLLPHEIGHLIFRDFIGFAVSVPAWLEEGVAQMAEFKKLPKAYAFLKPFVTAGQHIPFDAFFHWNLKETQAPALAGLFYAQSLAVLDFLLKKYGSQKFEMFCRNMKSGDSFLEAFNDVYKNYLGENFSRFEKEWVNFLKTSNVWQSDL